MTDWNQPPGGSAQSLEDVLKKILQEFRKFKGGALLIIAAVAVVAVFWTAYSKKSSAFGRWPPFPVKKPAMIRAAITRTSR